VYWSPTPSPGFFSKAVLGTGGMDRRYLSMPRPKQFKGSKCSICGVVRAELSLSCEHEMEEGFIFPYSRIFWWPGSDPFKPTFFFPLVTRSKNGREPEIVCSSRRFMVTIAAARVPAKRCVRCGSIEIPLAQTTA
jgi:hypothetical protein